MKKKNILLLVNQLHGGGAQKVVANLSIYLSEYYNVILAIYNDTDKVIFQFNGELVKLNLPHADNTHNNPLHKRMIRSISLVKQVRKLKKTRNIHATISFLEASNFINVLSKRKDKVIISVRSHLSNEFEDMPRLKIFSTFIRLLYNKSDHIVVPADLLKYDLVSNFNVRERKIKLIYNFTDLKLVETHKKEGIQAHHNKIFSGDAVIINIGRISYPKAQWLQPMVLARLKKMIPEAKLVILGDGPLKERIVEKAMQEGLKVYDEVINNKEDLSNEYDLYLLGFTKNPFPYLAKSNLFLKSSVYEGFPNVIIEAMSCGLPVVSSDCPSGPREILSPSTDILSKAKFVEYAEYGILTPVAGSEEIDDEKYANVTADAIAEILTDKGKFEYYRSQSIVRASAFEVKEIIAQWIQLIESN